MQYYYGYSFLAKQRRENIIKKVALIGGLLLILQISLGGLFFIDLPFSQAGNDNMCEADVDVVLIMDRSGSMAEGESDSQCRWYQVEWVGPSMQCVRYNATGLTEQECNDKPNPPQCSGITYTPASNSKIVDAKDAANTFISYLGSNDQSSLVSFADSATLDQQFTNIHSNTQNAVNALTTGGATNIGDAIVLANQEITLSGRANPQANKIVILLTDGIANRPNGVGDPELYAKEKAVEAAAQDIKIFTIGLGSDVNETMLQDIATITSADYYYAPTSAELEDIYNQISTRICEYGSISGCKYQDSDPSDDVITGNTTLSGWEIVLTGGANGPIVQETDGNGCYAFAGLLPGTYNVSESANVDKQPFLQTYPQGSYYDITLGTEESAADIDFGNYLPECGNNIVDTGYIGYTDEECDNGNDNGQPGSNCDYDCTSIFIQEYGTISGYKYEDTDNNINTTEYSGNPLENWVINLFDYEGSVSEIASTTTDVYGYYEFTGLIPGNYYLGEEMPDSSWTQLPSLASPVVVVGNGHSDNNNFVNYHAYCGNEIIDGDEGCDDGPQGSATCTPNCTKIEQGEDPYCGDGIKNQESEECDGSDGVPAGYTCTSSCKLQGGGNGGGGSTPLSLRNEQVVCVSETEVVVTWFTNKNATGRVVYGMESQASIGSSPNYGYTFSTEESIDKSTSHSATIAGLTNNIYYFKPISSASPDTFGKEISFNMANCREEVIVKGEEGEPILNIEKQVMAEFANPGDENIEYKISITNNGNITAYNVVLTDALPAGFAYSDGSEADKIWELGDIESGQTKGAEYFVNIASSTEPGIYANIAQASADNHGNISASVDLEIKGVEVLSESGFNLNEYILLLITMAAFAGLVINLKIKYAADFGPSSTMFYKPIASNKKYHRSQVIEKYPDLYKVKR